jgi:hypothetical protein
MRRAHEAPGVALALSELERAVVEAEGDRTLFAGVSTCQYLQVSTTEIALQTGLTRTRIYSVRERYDDKPADGRSEVKHRPLTRLFAASLTDGVPLGLGAHARHLGVPVEAAEMALKVLCDRGVAEALARTAQYEGGPITEVFFVPGPEHADWLQNELDVLRWVRQDRFGVYMELPRGARDIVAAGAYRIGPDLATVIKAGTVTAVTWDELAVGVVAHDSRDALAIARDVWDKIWADAELPAPPWIVRELIPPTTGR